MELARVVYTSTHGRDRGKSTTHIFVSLDGQKFKEVDRAPRTCEVDRVKEILDAPTLGYDRSYLRHAGATFEEY